MRFEKSFYSTNFNQKHRLPTHNNSSTQNHLYLVLNKRWHWVLTRNQEERNNNFNIFMYESLGYFCMHLKILLRMRVYVNIPIIKSLNIPSVKTWQKRRETLIFLFVFPDASILFWFFNDNDFFTFFDFFLLDYLLIYGPNLYLIS